MSKIVKVESEVSVLSSQTIDNNEAKDILTKFLSSEEHSTLDSSKMKGRKRALSTRDSQAKLDDEPRQHIQLVRDSLVEDSRKSKVTTADIHSQNFHQENRIAEYNPNPNVFWDKMYISLLEFHEENGHYNVPHRFDANPSLGTWVQTQRSKYKKLQEEGSNDKKLEILDKIGFNWNDFVPWEEYFNELKEFKEKFGHTNVPVHYPPSIRFGKWMQKQRQQLKKFRDGKKSTMTPERKALLDEIGLDNLWNQRYKELIAFRKAHGHCRVPEKTYIPNLTLGRWVKTQRYNYKRMLDGKSHSLLPKYVEELDRINFYRGEEVKKENDEQREKCTVEVSEYAEEEGDVASEVGVVEV